MKLSLSLCCLLVACVVSAQSYHAGLIADSLRNTENAVKRFEEIYISIKSPAKAVVKHRYAITILNSSGEDQAGYVNSYSALFPLNHVEGRLYDQNGNELRSVKKKEFTDEPYNDQISLASDLRIKRHHFYHRTFPYTIEYEDETELNGLFFLPRWSPVADEQFSVEKSRFVVEMPLDYQLRYKVVNTASPFVSKGVNTTILTWELQHFNGIEFEEYQPELAQIVPSVFVAPTAFEFGGYKGNMDTWQNLGSYMLSLYKGRDELPANIKADVHRITDHISDKKEKIRLLYEYMQQNTRYISIQLGIGGWQPFDASYVATNRYGDCKALSNYMVSILKEAGITANHVIIMAGDGRRGLFEDFPAPNFNHVVMCVPNGQDTTWLECTDQTVGAGYMGSFTGNRKALMLTDKGGVVVSTPYYSIADNQQTRRVEAVIDASGNLDADVYTRFTGEQQEQQHQLIHNVSKEQRDKYLNSRISLPMYQVVSYNYKQAKGKIPVVDEYLKLTATNYANITGKRLFIKPNLFNKMGEKLSADKPRKYDITFTFSFRDVDTIRFKVPDGYTVEAMPRPVTLETAFGKYSIAYTVENNRVEMLRTYQRSAGQYPAAEYPKLVSFFESIYKADRSTIVLVKKEG